jgi:hypothetical protein
MTIVANSEPEFKLVLKPVEIEYLSDSTGRAEFKLNSIVRLDVSPGECVVLRGGNSTGKSMFLDSISGRRSQQLRTKPSHPSKWCLACPPKPGPVLMRVVQLAGSQGATHAKTTRTRPHRLDRS